MPVLLPAVATQLASVSTHMAYLSTMGRLSVDLHLWWIYKCNNGTDLKENDCVMVSCK